MTKIRVFLAAMLTVGATAGVALAAVPISQKDKTYSPEEVTAKVGETLHIENDDTVSHNALVQGASGKVTNSGVQKPGESVDVILDEAGLFTVRCGIHPKMKLLVHVQ